MKTQAKTITLRQIAKLARTSKSTVSRVLTKHPSVSPKTRARIEAVIQKQGFRPNLFARGLAGGRTGLIGVLTSEINSGFYAEVIKGIDEVVGQHDGHVLSSFAHGTADYIGLWRSLSTGGRVDGMILIAPPLDILSEDPSPGSVPVVLCSCRPGRPGSAWEGVDTVTVNNEKGMNEILRHLIDQGRRNLIHVGGPHDIYDAVERRKSFDRFVEDHPNVRGTAVSAPMTREGGRAAVLELLKKQSKAAEAFVACNDLAAVGVLEALKESGIPVPGSIAVTGCDDDASSGVLGLTTLHMPMVDLGRETARLLFDRLDSRAEQTPARHSVLEMTLRVRTTTTR